MNLQSYVYGEWHDSPETGAEVFSAVTGESIAHVSSTGIDFSKVLSHGRDKGGPALRALTVHERALALKKLGLFLLERKQGLYEISRHTGATKADSWVDIEGGINTMLSYSRIAQRELPNESFVVEGEAERLSAKGSFVGRHILTPKQGVSVHINAFNFPVWGMLEKIAPSLIAGVPAVVKPATVTSYLAEALVREIVDSRLLPEGSIQLICGNTGDLLDHLNEQDSVTFTGSASTGLKLRCHPNIIQNSIPFNLEADSLNCSILGETVDEDDPEFDLFTKEVCQEMTSKAGQKCTAIRRILVPREKLESVQAAIISGLDKVVIGDPSAEGVTMGPLAGCEQKEDVRRNVEALSKHCQVVHGGDEDLVEVIGEGVAKGAFYPPTLMLCDHPRTTFEPHEIEPFGPVSTLMPYDGLDDAVEIARMGKGSLVGSIVSYDDAEVEALVVGTAAYHGRLLILNRDCARESTGHGSPLAPLVHGGPGRAGGGEELGGVRAVKHYMQRTAIQGSPTALVNITRQYMAGSDTISADIHPFRKYFDDLRVGESMKTHRRTVTEADIVNFGCLSGDHFYAHFDEVAAKDSPFGQRVAHGYFVLSAAAGLFVDPSPGPVLANYGLENLRFVQPVGIGDTIRARITVKQKIKKDKRPDETRATGVVVWDVEVTNQNEDVVAVYDIMTLVERHDDVG